MIRPRRLLSAGTLLFSLLLISGCAESIRTYEVPVVKQRLLGALIETDDGLWAIKLMGNTDDVTSHKEEFEQFIKSIRIPGKGKERIEWTPPKDWAHEAGKEMRYATFRLPKNLEVGVFAFPGGGGDVLRNVNRWRDQLKLGAVGKEDIARIGRLIKLDSGQMALMLDMESARTTAPPAEPSDNNADSPLTYKKPGDWVEEPDPGQFAVAAFRVRDGEKKARITITVAGGAFETNIKRWRDELDLPVLDAQQMRKELRDTTVAGRAAFLLDLVGKSGKSTFGVICPVGDAGLFVKMMGDSELVAKQKPAFEAFVASLKIRGEN